jgi:hypothetical protein
MWPPAMVAFFLFLDGDGSAVGFDIRDTTVRLVEPHVFLVQCVGNLLEPDDLVDLLDVTEPGIAYFHGNRFRWLGGCRYGDYDEQ